MLDYKPLFILQKKSRESIKMLNLKINRRRKIYTWRYRYV